MSPRAQLVIKEPEPKTKPKILGFPICTSDDRPSVHFSVVVLISRRAARREAEEATEAADSSADTYQPADGHQQRDIHQGTSA